MLFRANLCVRFCPRNYVTPVAPEFPSSTELFVSFFDPRPLNFKFSHQFSDSFSTRNNFPRKTTGRTWSFRRSQQATTTLWCVGEKLAYDIFSTRRKSSHWQSKQEGQAVWVAASVIRWWHFEWISNIVSEWILLLPRTLRHSRLRLWCFRMAPASSRRQQVLVQR